MLRLHLPAFSSSLLDTEILIHYLPTETIRLDDTYILFMVSRYPHDDLLAAGLGCPFASLI
jgi:hypothetical protein